MLEVHPFTLYITLTQHDNIVVTTTSQIHLNDHRSSGNTTTYTGTIITHNIQNQLISELKYLHDRICEIRGSPPLTATQSLCLSSSQTEICTCNINQHTLFTPNSVRYSFCEKLRTSGQLQDDPRCLKIKSYWSKKLEQN